jgi:hypothetical protein
VRIARVAWLLACASCSQLFGLTEVATQDAAIDAAPDAAPSCENSAPFGTSCRDVMLTATNDTFLSAAAPSTVFGGEDAVKISSTEPGLFKFYTGDFAPGERIAAMTLTLDANYVRNATVCSATFDVCELCPMPGYNSWQLAYATTTWNEAQASWAQAAPGVAWAAAGASDVPNDHSAPIAMGPAPGSGNLVMVVPQAALLAHSPDCYRSSDALALRVTIDGLGYFESHEQNPCDSVVPNPARLLVTLCQ